MVEKECNSIGTRYNKDTQNMKQVAPLRKESGVLLIFKVLLF
jgi:hypothetical protein